MPSVSTSGTPTATESKVPNEMPSSEWGDDANSYMIGGTQRGRLSGPWDEEIAKGDAVARTQLIRS